MRPALDKIAKSQSKSRKIAAEQDFRLLMSVPLPSRLHDVAIKVRGVKPNSHMQFTSPTTTTFPTAADGFRSKIWKLNKYRIYPVESRRDAVPSSVTTVYTRSLSRSTNWFINAVGAIFSAYSLNQILFSVPYRNDRNSIFSAATLRPH